MATGLPVGKLYRRPQKSLALTWVHTLSPTFFNELIVSGTRGIYLGREGDGSGVGTDTNWSDKFKRRIRSIPSFGLTSRTPASSYALQTERHQILLEQLADCG